LLQELNHEGQFLTAVPNGSGVSSWKDFAPTTSTSILAGPEQIEIHIGCGLGNRVRTLALQSLAFSDSLPGNSIPG
jgi:hypothetical protein